MDSDEKKKNIFCNLKDFIRLIQKYFEGQIKKRKYFKSAQNSLKLLLNRNLEKKKNKTPKLMELYL